VPCVRWCSQFDAHGKPWLLEVNADPALGTGSPLDLKVKSSMLVDAFNVLSPPLPPPAPLAGSPPAAAGVRRASSSAIDARAAEPSEFACWRDAHAERTAGIAQDELVSRWAMHVVNAELRRSRETSWRRLFPAADREHYQRYLDPARRLHFLPFDV
jgi:hypothetical protein